MNIVTLIGRLTRDPELSYTQSSNTAKCTFSIAIDRPKRNGEDQGADFIRIVCWNRQAETCDQYLRKGSQVAVSGSIRSGSYDNKVGVKVYTTDVWANRVEFLGKSNNDDSPREDYFREEQPQSNSGYTMPMSFDDLPDTFSAADDDIPF